MTTHETGGSPGWLDMSRYPDTDPETVLTEGEHGLLTDALAVDDAALPDAVWEHMLAMVTGDDPGDDGADGADGADPSLLAADDHVDPVDGWALDEDASHDPSHDPAHDPVDPAHDPGHHDWGGWDGGLV